MKLQQLRYVIEILRHDNHLSAAAESLNTSQSGVSKQIQLLEAELGFAVFERNRNRILGLTEPGRQIADIARRVVTDVESMKAVKEEFTNQESGALSIAATHTPARYLLPQALDRFRRMHPLVRLSLRQGNPAQICTMVDSGVADVAVGTETSQAFPELLRLSCAKLARSVIARRGHPILRAQRVTLAEIAKYPMITNDPAFSGRWRVMDAFKKQGLEPSVMFGIVDADVSKAYVELGFGIAIIASIAVDEKRDPGLRARDVSHILEPSAIYVSLRKQAYLRKYVFDFIQCLCPKLTEAHVKSKLSEHAVSRR